MSDSKRMMTLAINVPAYCKVVLPDDLPDEEEALRTFAQKQIERFVARDSELVFEPEWESAIEGNDRIIDVVEVDASDGTVLRVIAEDLHLDVMSNAGDGVALCASEAAPRGAAISGP